MLDLNPVYLMFWMGLIKFFGVCCLFRWIYWVLTFREVGPYISSYQEVPHSNFYLPLIMLYIMLFINLSSLVFSTLFHFKFWCATYLIFQFLCRELGCFLLMWLRKQYHLSDSSYSLSSTFDYLIAMGFPSFYFSYGLVYKITECSIVSYFCSFDEIMISFFDLSKI